MRIALISALMLATTTGCIKTNDNSNVQVADHEAITIDDCFTSLVAGKQAAAGKLETISFAHGVCKGSSKALDKLSESKFLSIVKGEQTFEAQLFIQGADVMASLDGLSIKIGTLNKNPDDAELSLNSGAKLELIIITSTGTQEIWKPGSATTGKEIIRLTLI